jgi:hypothetical protein
MSSVIACCDFSFYVSYYNHLTAKMQAANGNQCHNITVVENLINQ